MTCTTPGALLKPVYTSKQDKRICTGQKDQTVMDPDNSHAHNLLVLWRLVVDSGPGHVEVACRTRAHDDCVSDIGVPGSRK